MPSPDTLSRNSPRMAPEVLSRARTRGRPPVLGGAQSRTEQPSLRRPVAARDPVGRPHSSPTSTMRSTRVSRARAGVPTTRVRRSSLPVLPGSADMRSIPTSPARPESTRSPAPMFGTGPLKPHRVAEGAAKPATRPRLGLAATDLPISEAARVRVPRRDLAKAPRRGGSRTPTTLGPPTHTHAPVATPTEP